MAWHRTGTKPIHERIMINDQINRSMHKSPGTHLLTWFNFNPSMDN